uniref:Homeobox domain-containing protein n=1 Tax=Romanomermis culicivorax TaxID=13658 RepID=A0A915IUV6_ROMCU
MRLNVRQFPWKASLFHQLIPSTNFYHAVRPLHGLYCNSPSPTFPVESTSLEIASRNVAAPTNNLKFSISTLLGHYENPCDSSTLPQSSNGTNVCWPPHTVLPISTAVPHFRPAIRTRRAALRRAVFSDAQRKGLEERFLSQRYISKPDRKKLADQLGLKDSQVKIWFQNRRMKWRNSKDKSDQCATSNCNLISPCAPQIEQQIADNQDRKNSDQTLLN